MNPQAPEGPLAKVEADLASKKEKREVAKVKELVEVERKPREKAVEVYKILVDFAMEKARAVVASRCWRNSMMTVASSSRRLLMRTSSWAGMNSAFLSWPSTQSWTYLTWTRSSTKRLPPPNKKCRTGFCIWSLLVKRLLLPPRPLLVPLIPKRRFGIKVCTFLSFL